MPPTTASPKKQPPAPAPAPVPSSTAVASKPVVEPADPHPTAPKSKVAPLSIPEPDGVSSCSVSSCSVSHPLPDSQENVQTKEQKEPLIDEIVSELKQPEEGSSDTLPIEDEAENHSTETGSDVTAAPAEVETQPQISQDEASPTENMKVESENSPDVTEEPGLVGTTDTVLQEVPPVVEQATHSTAPNEERVEKTEVELGEQSQQDQIDEPQITVEVRLTESQIAAREQPDPEPVVDAGLREDTPPPPPPPPPPSPLPPLQGEVTEVVENVVSRSDEAQQEPILDSAKCEGPEPKAFISDGIQEPEMPEPPEEVTDLRDAAEQKREENQVSEKVSTREETVGLKIPQRADEEISGEIKAAENNGEEINSEEKVVEPVKEEAGNENEPSKAPEEQRFCSHAALENANEVKAEEGKRPEEARKEETNDQKTPEKKVNGSESSRNSPSSDTNTHKEVTEEEERREAEFTAAEAIPKDETQKIIRTESETTSITHRDKHQNRNTEEPAQMASDVIKAKMGEDTQIQGSSQTCSLQTNCEPESQKETEREEEEERPEREKALIKDEEGKEAVSQNQETLSETEKSEGGAKGGKASPECEKDKISNEEERTETNFEEGGVAVTVESVAEPQILVDVANERENRSQEENANREETKEAEDQLLGKASEEETVAEVTVEFS